MGAEGCHLQLDEAMDMEVGEAVNMEFPAVLNIEVLATNRILSYFNEILFPVIIAAYGLINRTKWVVVIFVELNFKLLIFF